MTSDKRGLSDIEADLDDNRDRLGRTLDSLQHRLSSENITERGRDYLRATGGAEFASNLGQSIRLNPVPVAVLGVGMAWIMLSTSSRAGGAISRNTPDSMPGFGRNRDGQGSSQGSSMRDTMASASERAKSTARGLQQRAEHATGRGQDHFNQASDRAQHGVDRARRGVSQASERAQRNASYAADNARRGASRASERAQRGASYVADNARRGGARVMDGADYMYREQPLLTAALGLALGGVLAATLPRSRQENEAMGSTRDDVVASAWETGQEKAGQAQSVAESAARGARDAAQSEAERQDSRAQRNDTTTSGEDSTRG